MRVQLPGSAGMGQDWRGRKEPDKQERGAENDAVFCSSGAEQSRERGALAHDREGGGERWRWRNMHHGERVGLV